MHRRRSIPQQLGEIVAGIQRRQVLPQLWIAPHDLRFREQIEATGGFAEQDYTAQAQEVKGTFEAGFEPPPALGQAAHLPQLARPQRHDPAGLAPVGSTNHQSQGFFGHLSIVNCQSSIVQTITAELACGFANTQSFSEISGRPRVAR